MLDYALTKVFALLFQTPGREWLMTPLGQLTHQELLWLFMGSSLKYTVFTGLVEPTGSVLLLFARTTLFGALVTVAALGNVVRLNYFYNINVKQIIIHLTTNCVNG